MPDITYRVATVQDLPTLVELRCRFLTEANGRPVPEPLREEIRKSFLEHTATGRFVSWLAECDGRAVATGCLVYWDLVPSLHWSGGRKAYIMNMFTEAPFRRRGIAAEIVGRLLTDARAAGVSEASLHALPDGVGVYKRIGFEATGDEMRIRW
jgi:GNAT superfamily N-acetyltransferase